MTLSTDTSSHGKVEAVRVVDADTHMTERHALGTSRAPAALRDRVPQVARLDGMACWCVDGAILGRAGAGGVVDNHGDKGRSFEGLYEWEIDKAHIASYDPDARVALMDELGVYA